MQKKSIKFYLGLTLKAVLSILLIFYVLRDVDFDKLLVQLSEASVTMVVASTFILTLQFVVATARWQAVLGVLGVAMHFMSALKIIFISNFFNQILPSSIGGDAVRIYKAHKAGLALATSINSVLLERVATILGLFLLVVAFQPFFMNRGGDMGPQWLLGILTIIAFLGTGMLMLLDRLPAKFSRWRLVRGGAKLAQDTRTVFLNLRHTSYILLLSVFGHINIVVGVWVLGLALGLGEQLTLINSMVLIPLVLLVTTLPISIAGWGVREASMVTAFGFIGIAPENALILSVVFGLQTLVIALPGGLVWLGRSDRNIIKADVFPN